MVRNEADIVEAFIRHHADHVDGLLIADNLSDDETLDILDRLAVELPNLVVTIDNDPAYRQSEKMTALAHRARVEFGAEWIIPADADEFWLPNAGTLAEVCQAQPPRVGILPAAVFDHVLTHGEGFDSMTYRMREPQPRWAQPRVKVACRARADLTIDMGNHWARYARRLASRLDLLTIRHFPIRSFEQFARKSRQGAAALQLADLPRSSGAHWRRWGSMSDVQLRAKFRDYVYDQADPRIVDDPL